jgi:hypothetical protein
MARTFCISAAIFRRFDAASVISHSPGTPRSPSPESVVERADFRINDRYHKEEVASRPQLRDLLHRPFCARYAQSSSTNVTGYRDAVRLSVGSPSPVLLYDFSDGTFKMAGSRHGTRTSCRAIQLPKFSAISARRRTDFVGCRSSRKKQRSLEVGAAMAMGLYRERCASIQASR